MRPCRSFMPRWGHCRQGCHGYVLLSFPLLVICLDSSSSFPFTVRKQSNTQLETRNSFLLHLLLSTCWQDSSLRRRYQEDVAREPCEEAEVNSLIVETSTATECVQQREWGGCGVIGVTRNRSVSVATSGLRLGKDRWWRSSPASQTVVTSLQTRLECHSHPVGSECSPVMVSSSCPAPYTLAHKAGVWG